MRLWNKDILSVLARKQLVAQWRECCCIAKNLSIDGTPNHILVNKILEYPIDHFTSYTRLVINEMERRGYNVSDRAYSDFCINMKSYYKKSMNRTDTWAYSYETVMSEEVSNELIYKGWHNTRYLRQCYFNLQEKYDCGGINEDEWNIIKDKISKMI